MSAPERSGDASNTRAEPNAERESQQSKRKTHSLVHVSLASIHGKRESGASNDSLDGRLDLFPGENWLSLGGSELEGLSFLDATQDTAATHQGVNSTYASVLSLEAMGKIDDAPNVSCFLSLDIYKDVLTIKDMRDPKTGEDTADSDQLEIGILPQGTNRGLVGKALERLERRRMRVLRPGDRICTMTIDEDGGPSLGGLLLEYRYETKAGNEETDPPRLQDDGAAAASADSDEDEEESGSLLSQPELKLKIQKKAPAKVVAAVEQKEHSQAVSEGAETAKLSNCESSKKKSKTDDRNVKDDDLDGSTDDPDQKQGAGAAAATPGNRADDSDESTLDPDTAVGGKKSTPASLPDVISVQVPAAEKSSEDAKLPDQDDNDGKAKANESADKQSAEFKPDDKKRSSTVSTESATASHTKIASDGDNLDGNASLKTAQHAASSNEPEEPDVEEAEADTTSPNSTTECAIEVAGVVNEEPCSEPKENDSAKKGASSSKPILPPEDAAQPSAVGQPQGTITTEVEENSDKKPLARRFSRRGKSFDGASERTEKGAASDAPAVAKSASGNSLDYRSDVDDAQEKTIRASRKRAHSSSPPIRERRMPRKSTRANAKHESSGEEDDPETCKPAARGKPKGRPLRKQNREEPLEEDVSATPVEDKTEKAKATSAKRARREGTDVGNTSQASAARGNRATAAKSRGDAEELRILVTKVELNKKQIAMVKKLGGVLVEDVKEAHTATHVIASDGKQPLKRTPKLMIALNKTANIVSLKWLVDSAKRSEPLPCDKYLILDDKVAEKQYEFVMKDTLKQINQRLEEESPLLEHYSVYVCKGVAGNKAPPQNELKLIVEAAGGRWIASPAGIAKQSSLGADHKGTLIITSSDTKAAQKQRKVRAVETALEKAGTGAFLKTACWLFHAMMTQELDVDT